MKYTIEQDFENFEPWSGARSTFERIINEGKAAAADAYFNEIEPEEGWTDTAINDVLWFDSASIFKALGMKPDDTHTHTADEIGEAWQEENDDAGKVSHVNITEDGAEVFYIDEDGAEDSETLDAGEVAALFGDDCGEIDAEAGTVETWED